MKSKKKDIFLSVFTIIIFNIVAVSGPASADDGFLSLGKAYIGTGYSYIDADMETDFTRWTNGAITEESSFRNTYDTNRGSLFAGYTFPWKSYYLSTQAGVNLFDDEFKTSAGSSDFTNSLNHSFSIDFIPGVYLYKKWSLFAKCGVIYGDFDFVKLSPTSTTYDVSEYLFGGTLGIGLAYDITPRVTVKLGYEKSWYNDKTINATKGNRLDSTIVAPEMEIYSLTFQYYFK